MKKELLKLFVFIALIQNVSGQTNSVIVENSWTTQKIFTGIIDDKYNIVMCLRHYNWGVHERTRSLIGWYYYEKQKKKIPIVGLFTEDINQSGNLTLYSFKDENLQNYVLNLENDSAINETDTFPDIYRLENVGNFEEKFQYFNETRTGSWTNGKSKLKFNFSDPNTFFEICNKSYYLKMVCFGKTYVMDMSTVCEDQEFTLVRYSVDKKSLKLLLYFDYVTPNTTPMGMCGAGQESGYIKLEFDNEYHLIDFDRVLINSCLSNIESEEISSDDKDIKVFKVSNADKTIKVTVNQKSMEIKNSTILDNAE